MDSPTVSGSSDGTAPAGGGAEVPGPKGDIDGDGKVNVDDKVIGTVSEVAPPVGQAMKWVKRLGIGGAITAGALYAANWGFQSYVLRAHQRLDDVRVAHRMADQYTQHGGVVDWHEGEVAGFTVCSGGRIFVIRVRDEKPEPSPPVPADCDGPYGPDVPNSMED